MEGGVLMAGSRRAARLRRVLSLPALCASFAMLVVLPSSASAAGRSTATPSRCRVAAPTTAAGYAKSFGSIRQGGDASLSVSLPSGRVAWIYADTVFPHNGFLSSTVIMQDRGCFRATRTQFLPSDRDRTFWWPEAATALPGGRVLVVAGNGYGHRLRAAIAVERAGALVFDRWLPYWPQPGNGPSLSAGLLVAGSTLWVYGTRKSPVPLHFGKQLYAASVPISRIGNPSAWNMGPRAVWGTFLDGVDTAVAPYRDDRGVHLLTLSNGVLGGGPVIELSSVSPSGPFTRREVLNYSRPGQIRYNVSVHPQARLRGGAILLTVNNNWPFGDRSVHPVTSYQPSFFQFVR
jgi:hypothetical protein